MLDLQRLNAQDLRGLSPSSLADVAAQMLARIGEQSKFIDEQSQQLHERNKQIASQAQAIKFKDVKIERITFELPCSRNASPTSSSNSCQLMPSSASGALLCATPAVRLLR